MTIEEIASQFRQYIEYDGNNYEIAFLARKYMEKLLHIAALAKEQNFGVAMLKAIKELEK